MAAKIGLDDDSFGIHSSSHIFQSLTGKSTICESSHIYFFTKKIDLGFSYVNISSLKLYYRLMLQKSLIRKIIYSRTKCIAPFIHIL
ncbi:Uncharacterized protein GNX_1730 [Leptospira interrogans serovar Canicola]|nr:Uncharacterized protein GNX_1730 [Leptospira interrogans serovar Canicola]